MYRAKNVDTDKVLGALHEARKAQEQDVALEIEKKRAYLNGVYEALDIAESMFCCSNFERDKEPEYADGVVHTIYELGKELDICTQDLRDNFSSVDEICSEMAERIKERFGA